MCLDRRDAASPHPKHAEQEDRRRQEEQETMDRRRMQEDSSPAGSGVKGKRPTLLSLRCPGVRVACSEMRVLWRTALSPRAR